MSDWKHRIDKFWPYLAIIITSFIALHFYMAWEKQRPFVKFAALMKQKEAFFSQWRAKPIDDFLLVEENGGESSLYQLLQGSDAVVFLITSLKECNQCRERELASWNDAMIANRDLKVFSLVSEGQQVSESESRALLIGAHRNDIGIPSVLDPTGEVIHFFGITPKQTPLVVLVQSATKKIIAVNRPHPQSPEFDRQFISLISRISE